jgi:aerobic carbon-monoxide dehydrogenase medium subunit
VIGAGRRTRRRRRRQGEGEDSCPRQPRRRHIGDPQVRNRGTIGGSIANNDPAADYPGRPRRPRRHGAHHQARDPADDFFTGMFETALAEDEIVTAVAFPVPEKRPTPSSPTPPRATP